MEELKQQGLRLKKVRLWSGLNQKEFAEKIGVVQQNLSQIENGKRFLSNKAAKKFSEVFSEIDMKWLYTGEGDMLVGEHPEKQFSDMFLPILKTSGEALILARTLQAHYVKIISKLTDKTEDQIWKELKEEMEKQKVKFLKDNTL